MVRNYTIGGGNDFEYVLIGQTIVGDTPETNLLKAYDIIGVHKVDLPSYTLPNSNHFMEHALLVVQNDAVVVDGVADVIHNKTLMGRYRDIQPGNTYI